jgi:hypothetical protein
MLKKCSRCKQEKDASFFACNSSRKDNLQSLCKACQKVYGQQRYLKNKDYFKEHNKQSSRIKRLAIDEYKKGKMCVDCGNTNPVVLTFDHVRGEKVAAVTDMANRSFTLSAIYKEIAKCDLRCFNCHMIKDCQKRATAAATTLQP